LRRTSAFAASAGKCELKTGGFSAEFSIEEHDADGVLEAEFYLPSTFPPQAYDFLPASALVAAAGTGDKEKVWSLEQAWWRFLQGNDLEHFHIFARSGIRNFLVGRLLAPEPLHKDHITDWITNHTSRGRVA